MPNWIKENKTPITVAISSIVAMTAIVGILQTSINSIHHQFDDMNHRFDDQDKYINQRFDAVDQRFDAINQRFDIQDRRIEDLAKDISELRKRSDRVSRNKGELDVIRQQLKIAETQPPPEPGSKNTRGRQALTPTTSDTNDILSILRTILAER